MTPRIRTTRTPRADPLPPRWRALVTLLETHPQGLTIKEIAQGLGGIKTATAYTYLSEAAKEVTIRGEGPYGGMRYFLDKSTSTATAKEG